MAFRPLLDEVERALQQGVACLGRTNGNLARCVVCRAECKAGFAYMLRIDGHRRGFICFGCSGGIPTRREMLVAQKERRGEE